MKKILAVAAIALLASCINNDEGDAPSGAVSMHDFQGTFVSADDYGYTVDIMPDSSIQGDFILVKPSVGIATGIIHFTQSTLQFYVLGTSVVQVFYWDWIWARGRWRLSFDDGNTLFMEAN